MTTDTARAGVPACKQKESVAERAVLSCCLLDPSILQWLELDTTHFAEFKNRAVWEAMQGLAGDDIDADLVLIESALRSAGKLDAVGLAYLAEVAMVAATGDNVEHYADLLRTARTTRRALNLAEMIPIWVKQGDEGEDLLDRISSTSADLAQQRARHGRTLPEMVRTESQSISKFLDDQASGKVKVSGVPTGIPGIDDPIGGIPRGLITLMGARPKDGKSTLTQNVVKHATAEGYGVHWFSNEDQEDTFAQRWLSNESGVPATDIRTRAFAKGALKQISAAETELAKHSGLVFTACHGENARWITRQVCCEERRNKTSLVVIDLLARVPVPERGMSLRDRIGYNLDAFGVLAAKRDLAMLLLVHTKRGSDDEPCLDDLAESDFLGRDGKLILQLRPTKDTLDIWVTKNHLGVDNAVISTSFDWALCRIRP